MNIGTIKKYLAVASPELEVRFDFCYCVPTTVDSWRGIYAEPAIGWSVIGAKVSHTEQVVTAPTVAKFLSELNKATSGKMYTGWKGGNYRYTDNHTLHVDNPGDCSNTEIVAVEIGDYQVTLHTRREES